MKILFNNIKTNQISKITNSNLRFFCVNQKINETSFSKVKVKSNSYLIEGDLIINSNKDILLYYSKIPLLNKLSFHIPKLSIISAHLLFLIKNPLYLTFPAALPIVAISIMIYLIKYYANLIHRRNIVSEIWINRTGENLKISYSKHSFFNKEKFTEINTSEMIKEKSFNIPSNILSINDSFPLTYNDYIKSNINYLKYWKKYLTNEKEYILIYKFPIYQRIDILIEIFNMKNIQYGKNNVYLLNENSNEYEKFSALRSLINELKKKI